MKKSTRPAPESGRVPWIEGGALTFLNRRGGVSLAFFSFLAAVIDSW